jgi:hypothetical protein
LTLIACVALLSARAMAIEPPRIAHYVSEFARISFVLDLSGELPKIRFDGNEEIFVLRWQPAAGGDRILLRDDGEIVLRISGLGGVTLFTPDNRRGIPVAPARTAQPLLASTPPIGFVRDIAGRIMMQLRAEVGKEIVFEANWNAVVGDRAATGILYDAIRNAGTALFEIVRTGPGRAAVIARLNRVRFVPAGQPGVFMQGDMLIVNFSAAQGLAGRPSSAWIARQARQILR